MKARLLPSLNPNLIWHKIMKLTRDDRDMMLVSVFLTGCIAVIFGVVVIAAIAIEAILKALF